MYLDVNKENINVSKSLVKLSIAFAKLYQISKFLRKNATFSKI